MYRPSPDLAAQLRVMHVVAPGAMGGIESVVQTLASAQQEAGVDVHVAAIVDRGDESRADAFLGPLTSAGVETHALELPPRGYLRERVVLADLCRKHRPSVVHTHGYRADLIDGGVAHHVDAAAVTTVHGFTRGGARNRCYEWLQRRAFRRFDAVVAVSRPLAEELVESGVPNDRLHLVCNAWRPSAPALSRDAARDTLDISRAAFVIGWAGRLSHEKGLDVMIDAMSELGDLPVFLSVVGDGRERAALEARARNRGISERVMWHGFVPNASTTFAAFDLFVLSSRSEGSPMVLFEAIAAGVPIIAATVGGVADQLMPDESRLVPPENPAALASAIRGAFANHESEIARARIAQRRLAGSHHVESWIGHYDAVYRSAIGRMARP